MIPFVKNKNKAVGIDFGFHTIKVVSLQKYQDQWKLMNFSKIPSNDTEAIKKAFSNMKINSGKIGVNTEYLKVKTKIIELPKMPDEELTEAMKWQVKDIIEGTPEEYVIRYLKFPHSPTDTKRSSFIVFTLKKDALTERERLLKKFGVRCDFIEPEVSALRFSFFKTFGKGSNEPYAFLEIGHEHSFFGLFHKENLLFFRSLNEISGLALTKSIERDLNVSEAKAEELKINYTSDTNEKEENEEKKKLKNTIANFLTKISLEIQRSIDAYAVLETSNIQPNGIFISGGGTYLSGFKEYLHTTLGFEVQRFRSFSGLDTSLFNEEQLKANEDLYAIACGLALH